MIRQTISKLAIVVNPIYFTIAYDVVPESLPVDDDTLAAVWSSCAVKVTLLRAVLIAITNWFANTLVFLVKKVIGIVPNVVAVLLKF